MTVNLKQLAERAQLWPEEDQQDLAEYARSIEARRAGTYHVVGDERAAVLEGLRQVSRGEFASDADVAELRSQYRT